MWRETKILLVHDQGERRKEFANILTFLDEDYLACASTEWREAVAASSSNPRVLCVLLGGIIDSKRLNALVEEFAEWDEFLPIIVLNEVESAELSSEIRSSVLASLEMPPSYSQLLNVLHRARVYREVYDQTAERRLQRGPDLFRSLVGASRSIQSMRQMMQQVADTEVSVLILGESGTGKEVIARNLHYNSKRRDGPFVPLNCGAIPPQLLESELFGHEKGAFPGAISTHIGRIELAQGGTLFLDEIGDMPLPMQTKLLRVLHERTFERIGGNRLITADVRVVAATHKDLEAMVRSDEFREDLLHNLNAFSIKMPPLRERTEDIPLLINELVSRMENEKRGSVRFNEASIMSLCQYSWPGNVRELVNLVERMASMYPHGIIGINELPKKFRYLGEGDATQQLRDELCERTVLLKDAEEVSVAPNQLPSEGLDLREYLAELEQNLIQQALDEEDGIVARAAERLNIRRTTLVEKMRKYGMGRS